MHGGGIPLLRRRFSADREQDLLKLLRHLLNLPCLRFVFRYHTVKSGLGLGASLPDSNTAVKTITAKCESR